VTARCPVRWRQDAASLIEPQRLDVHPRRCRDLAGTKPAFHAHTVRLYLGTGRNLATRSAASPARSLLSSAIENPPVQAVRFPPEAGGPGAPQVAGMRRHARKPPCPVDGTSVPQLDDVPAVLPAQPGPARSAVTRHPAESRPASRLAAWAVRPARMQPSAPQPWPISTASIDPGANPAQLGARWSVAWSAVQFLAEGAAPVEDESAVARSGDKTCCV